MAVVHGEASQSAAFAKRLQEKGHDAVIPKSGDRISF
ncbi:MAG: MBL fold metallo-hydrolase RNA specificity domain-containing protein [Desulfobacula sp.]